MSKKGGSSPSPYEAGQAQTQADRPNQNTAWGNTSWVRGSNGQWTQNQRLNPELQGLMDTAIGQQQQGYDLGALGAMPDASGARQQAIDFAYGQARSRLDPQFDQRENQMRTRLLNQGLSEGDSLYDQQMANFGRERNDAYDQAMASAVGQGTAAGQSMFGQQMAQRQQGLTEQGLAMNQPLQGFLSLLGGSGSLGMPQFNQAGLLQGALGSAQQETAQRGQNLAFLSRGLFG